MQAEVFDEVFRQMRRDYKALVKPALLMSATWVVFAFAYHFNFFNPLLQATGWPLKMSAEEAGRVQQALTDLRLRFLPIAVVQFCAYLFFHLVLIVSCRQARDGKPDLRSAIGIAARRWPRYLGAVGVLLAIAAAVGGGLFFVANTFSPPPAVRAPGLTPPTPVQVAAGATGLVVALYVGLRLNLFPFAIGLDGAGPVGSLRKSWKATKGQWWSMFMALIPLFILLALVWVGVGLVTSLPLTIPAGLTPFFGFSTGEFPPGTYPAALSWNQGSTLALDTMLFVFLVDVPFVYGHTVVWEITQEQFRPRPTASYVKKYATGPKPATRLASTSKYLTQNPSESVPVTAWRPPPKG